MVAGLGEASLHGLTPAQSRAPHQRGVSMSDEMTDEHDDTGRRQTDRRQSQQPFDGPDRRKGDRRSGTDRRATPRAEGLDEG